MKIIKKTLIVLAVLLIMIIALLALHPGSKRKVIDILADIHAYELSTFYPSSLSSSTFSAITAQDSRPISFQKMQLHIETVNTHSQSGGTATSHQSFVTYTNAGHSFVQITSEAKNNDITFQLFFALSYRGLFNLKYQRVVLSKEKSESLWRLDRIEDFIPMDSTAKQVVLVGKGKPVQPKNFHAECSINEKRAAKEIFQTLEGSYLEVNCNFYNENKVVVHTAESAYLINYGIALPLSEHSVNSKTNFYITDLKITP